MNIGVSEFVKRQTYSSKFSHFEGTWDELVELVQAQNLVSSVRPGYRDGVILVTVPAEYGFRTMFYSGVVEVTHETALGLTARFESRRPTEAPFIQVTAMGPKLPAKAVDIVLYRRDVLLEGGDNSTGADWDIISINARPTVEEEPLTPMAMARNMLELPGGTKATYTAEAFAHAIVYWSTRAMRG